MEQGKGIGNDAITVFYAMINKRAAGIVHCSFVKARKTLLWIYQGQRAGETAAADKKEEEYPMKEYLEINSAQDGLPLHVLVEKPQGEPLGILQLSHGMAEHKERYLPLMEYLAEQGFLVAIHDHRGHGESVRSQEDLGYFYEQGARALVEDLYQVTQLLKAQYNRGGKLPFYLLGHSMGSLAVRAYCRRYDEALDGLIVCGSPSYNSGSRFGRLLAQKMAKRKGEHYRSKLINALAFGPFAKSVNGAATDFDWICSERAVIDAYIEDPLCGFTFTLNGFISLFDLMAEAYAPQGWQMHRPDLPSWFISGEEDPCMGSKKKFLSSVCFLQERGYGEVSYRLYPGLRHEILNERGKEQIFAEIAEKLREWNRRAGAEEKPC